MYQNFQLKESKIRLTGYEWETNQPNAVVCLVHGVGEHAGRYDRMAAILQKSGIAMVGMDLRGHGLSTGKRGHTSPRKEILNDIDSLIEYANRKYQGTSIFLYGHSMGGNLALDYRKRGRLRTLPKGYIITSPWLILQRKIPNYLYLFSRLIAMGKPDFTMRSKINPEVLGNVQIITKQDNPHLIHGKISVKTALEGMDTADALLGGHLETEGTEPLKPLLLMHGSADKICDPDGSRKLAKIEKDLCTYIEWEGLYHEIHNGSPNSDGLEVIQAMIGWILRDRI